MGFIVLVLGSVLNEKIQEKYCRCDLSIFVIHVIQMDTI